MQIFMSYIILFAAAFTVILFPVLHRESGESCSLRVQQSEVGRRDRFQHSLSSANQEVEENFLTAAEPVPC